MFKLQGLRVFIFSAVLVWLCFPLHAQDNPKPTTLAIGAQAPDFSLPGIDGKTYTLADFDRYDHLVVIFSCNHCPTAQAYEDRIIDVVNDYADKNVGFVMISPNSPEAVSPNELGYTDLGDDLDDMVIRAKDKGFNFPYLFDGDDHKASIEYGPIATPHVFAFDKARKLQYVGRIDSKEKPGTGNAEDIRNALDAMLANKAPALAKTKTFGCSVKWSWKDGYKKRSLAEWAAMPVALEDISQEGLKKLMKNEDSGKLRLINVWATWCGPCIQEFPDFVEMDRMYGQRNFEFISLSADLPAAKTQALKMLTKWEASNQNYIIDFEDKYALIEAVHPDWNGSLPFSILLAPGGEVVWMHEGSIEPLALKKAIVDHELMGRVY